MTKHNIFVGALLFGVASVAFDAHAQTTQTSAAADGDHLEEIIVTAQRRDQSLQEVPIAITAVTADQLSAVGATDIADLNQIVPALQIQTATGFLVPRIRGVGTTALGPGLENSVGVYIDGVYLASQMGSILSLNNIERIEVLKGPQGTLFGRNATGGLIQVVTRKPTQDFVANASVGYGNYDTVTAGGYLSGGLASTLAADLAVQYSQQGEGYGVNQFNGLDVNRMDSDLAARSRWVFSPSDTTTLDLTGDYMRRTGTASAGMHLAPGTFAFGSGKTFTGSPWDTDSDVQPDQLLKAWGTSLRVDQGLGGLTLTSITAYRTDTSKLIFDLDLTTTPGSKLDLLHADRQFSQEFQLTSNSASSVQWVAGLYYFNATGGFDPAIINITGLPPIFPAPSTVIVNDDDVGTKSVAAYAQATMEIMPRTNLTLGARYTSEERTLDGIGNPPPVPFAPSFPPLTAFSYSHRYKSPSWRVALDHKLADDTLLYISYNRGFKSGGYNASQPFSPLVAFKPEYLDAYEAGFKSEWFDHKVRFNGAFFYYDYKDIQIGKFIAPAVNYVNGAGAEIYGADFDIEAQVTRNLSVSAGLSLVHDRFTSFADADFYYPQPFVPGPPGIGNPGGNAVCPGPDNPYNRCAAITTPADGAKGNKLPITPDATVNLGVHYELPTAIGTWLTDADYYYNDGWYGQPDNFLRQRSYDRIDAAIGWRSTNEVFTVRLWGKNLNDKAVASALVSNDQTTQIQYEPPRTYGVTLGVKF